MNEQLSNDFATRAPMLDSQVLQAEDRAQGRAVLIGSSRISRLLSLWRTALSKLFPFLGFEGERGCVPDAPIQVVAAVVSRGEDFLVCQRPYEKRHGGLWEFPGGKCELGESLAAAVKRELREELGVEVVEVGKARIVIQDPDSPYTIVFTPVRIVGEPVCHEHIELRWRQPHELALLPLAPSDRRFVQLCLAEASRTAPVAERTTP